MKAAILRYLPFAGIYATVWFPTRLILLIFAPDLAGLLPSLIAFLVGFSFGDRILAWLNRPATTSNEGTPR